MFDNLGEKLRDSDFGTHFFRYTIKSTSGKLDFIKPCNLCSVTDTFKRMKKKATNWERYLSNSYPNKVLMSKTYKIFLNNKK